MNFDIRFDFQRRERLGLIEAIWGQDKSIDQLKRLSESVLSKNELVFILFRFSPIIKHFASS